MDSRGRVIADRMTQGKESSDAERAHRLARMRSKMSRDKTDTADMPHFEHDVSKLVRTRLTPDELLQLRTAFDMFSNKKNRDMLKTKKLWNVMRSLGLAPTPIEFAQLTKLMDPLQKGTIKWTDFMKEMERYNTQYFNKPKDIKRVFEQVCSLATGNGGAGSTITIEEITLAMENLGFTLPADADEVEEDMFDIIGEIDSKGDGDIDLSDFVKLLTMPVMELPGELNM
mmetsp:Transcript_34227/g.69979  ORF Transcript_34227/g.69979 Transcript_34227/m.69979 type:complete len:228 (-) Transcript_34227:167-850(-)